MEKKKYSSETTTKKVHRKLKKVESKGSTTPIKKSQAFLVDDTILTKNCRSLSFVLNNLPSTKKDEVFKFEQNQEATTYVTLEDINQFLRMSWLNISILQIFTK